MDQQEIKRQNIENDASEVTENEVTEEQIDSTTYTEEDIKLGNELITAVIANDLVRSHFLFTYLC